MTPKNDVPRPFPLPRTAQVIQLPLWPEPTRGTPNAILRSALFAAIQGKTRQFVREGTIVALAGYSIKFTGERLDQADLDVWEQAVHLARCNPLGNVCGFKGYTFLKAIGRDTGKRNYQWLHQSLLRLTACAVSVRAGSRVFTGSLLSSCLRDEETGIYRLRLDPDTLALYAPSDWTQIEWSQREALRGKPLALWLHGFFASHAKPLPVKIETLRDLSGSTTKTTWHFRTALQRAFEDLGAVAGYVTEFDGDLVVVTKPATPTQTRHLSRGRPKKKI